MAVSLTSFDRPVILIAGGRDKDSDFSLLNGLIARNGSRPWSCWGRPKERLARVWEGLAPVYLAEDMAQAVRRAMSLADPGEVVLLSPGLRQLRHVQGLRPPG